MSVHMVPTAYASRMSDRSMVDLADRAPANPEDRDRTDGLVLTGSWETDPEYTFTYTPDLTTGETSAFEDTLEGLKWGMGMGEYRNRKQDWILANQMLGVASPTGVQIRDWLRAVTRIQQAILDSRDVSDG